MIFSLLFGVSAYAQAPAAVATTLPADNPLTWAPADINLVAQGDALAEWMRQPWFPSLVQILDGLAEDRVMPRSPWAEQLTQAFADAKRGQSAWQVLLGGRITLFASLQEQTPDAVLVVELPADAPDDAWAWLARIFLWQQLPALAGTTYQWRGSNLLVRPLGRSAVLYPAGSKLGADLVANRERLPARRLVDTPAFQASLAPIEPATIWGFYQARGAEGPAADLASYLVDMRHGAGSARLVNGQIEVDLAIDLSRPQINRLRQLPTMFGLLPALRTSEAALARPARHWRSVDDVLLAWNGPMRFPRQRTQLAPLGPQVILWLQSLEWSIPRLQIERDILSDLEDRAVLIWARASAERDRAFGASYPAIAVAVPFRQSSGIARLVENLPAVANPTISRLAGDPNFRVSKLPIDPPMYVLPLGRIAPRITTDELDLRLDRSELIWGLVDGWLVLGSDLDLVRRCLLAQAAPLEPQPIGMTSEDEHARDGEVATGTQTTGHELPLTVTARPRDIADALASWIAMIDRNRPEIFTEPWWQSLARTARIGPPRLGVFLRQSLAEHVDPPIAGGVVQVARVLPMSAADGVVQEGDLIFAINSTPLSHEQTFTDVNRLLYSETSDGRMRLGIVRNGRMQSVDVSVPQAITPVRNPLRQLRTWAEIFTPVERIDYQQRLEGRRLRVRVGVEFNSGPR